MKTCWILDDFSVPPARNDGQCRVKSYACWKSPRDVVCSGIWQPYLRRSRPMITVGLLPGDQGATGLGCRRWHTGQTSLAFKPTGEPCIQSHGGSCWAFRLLLVLLLNPKQDTECCWLAAVVSSASNSLLILLYFILLVTSFGFCLGAVTRGFARAQHLRPIHPLCLLWLLSALAALAL